MNIRQKTINNYVIFAVGSLTVKHMIVDIAMKKYTRRSGALFACKNSVSPARHCDARRASLAPRRGMAR
jgi:hypothetical protein